jgi:outer membrane protein OmpA-like peptidoglycan-associated protein
MRFFYALSALCVLFSCFARPGSAAIITCPDAVADTARGEELFNGSDHPDYQRIAALFRSAMDSCPTWSKPARYLADILAEQEQYPEAIKFYQEALAREPDDFEAMFYLGDVYLKTGQKVHALRFYNKGIRILENNNQLQRDNRELLRQYQAECRELAKQVNYVTRDWAINHLDRARDARLGTRPAISTAIEFVYNRADIEPDWQAQLDTLAEVLTSEAMQSYRQIIQGHADVDGDLEYNDRLSLARARAVREYLQAHGVKAENILAVQGMGERQQLRRRPGESDVAWKQRNRRVVFISCLPDMDQAACLRSAGSL